MSDLEDHVFADEIAEIKVNENTDQDNIILNVDGNVEWYLFDVEDVKAMAKHFGLLFS